LYREHFHSQDPHARLVTSGAVQRLKNQANERSISSSRSAWAQTRRVTAGSACPS
jgi:hypothetical protein